MIKSSFCAICVICGFLVSSPLLAADTAPVGARDQISEPWFIAGSQRHMADLFPSHVVHRAGHVSELPRAPQSLRDVTYEWKGREHTLDEILART